ncbi:YmfQ family protein [Cohnella panacarvi]|uniref:YmfQ family protein n=1 Tax=Cohnella panacarvi TaxID=400776 RepID=UPI00047D5765|nr:YmfQ family protein [Cohnella panacarvi]
MTQAMGDLFGVSPVNLMEYLPPYYEEILEFKKIMSSEGEELEALRSEKESVLAQMFLPTTTWGIERWERELGLAIEPAKPISWRREQVSAKLRGSGTTTREMIVRSAAAFSGGEVELVEYPDEHRFVVRFVGTLGIPPNMAGFVRMLEEIKPAHLAYSFEYTYTAWGALPEMSWGEASGLTWYELRTYGGAT